MKPIIHCEVTCGRCGAVVYRNYKNAKTISNLKNEIKDWKYTTEYWNTCPECLEKLKEERK